MKTKRKYKGGGVICAPWAVYRIPPDNDYLKQTIEKEVMPTYGPLELSSTVEFLRDPSEVFILS